MDLKKECSSCLEVKEVNLFNKKRSCLSGLSAFQPMCKVCQSKANKARYNNNKDKIKDCRKEHYAKNRLEMKEKRKAYRIKNLDLIRSYNKRYYLRNKDKFRENRHLGKKRLKQATPSWLTKDQKKLIGDFYHHAKDCQMVSGESYHVDHIVPIKGKNVCGLHVPWNLQVLPADINIAKKNKEPEHV